MFALLFTFAALLPPASVAQADTVDPAYAQFIGHWTCLTAAGSAVTMTFYQSADDVLHLVAPWANVGGAKGEFDHTFTHDRSGAWSTTQHSLDNTFRFSGDSTGFEGTSISFVGTQAIAPSPDSLRGQQTFTQRETFRFTSATTMEQVWERAAPGTTDWRPVSYSSCTKKS